MRKAAMPSLPSAASVLAKTKITSATAALLSQAFSPSSTQPLPARRAVVEMAGKSLPACGSVSDVPRVDEAEGESHAGARHLLGDERLGDKAGAVSALHARHLDAGEAQPRRLAQALARHLARALPPRRARRHVVAAEARGAVE